MGVKIRFPLRLRLPLYIAGLFLTLSLVPGNLVRGDLFAEESKTDSASLQADPAGPGNNMPAEPPAEPSGENIPVSNVSDKDTGSVKTISGEDAESGIKGDAQKLSLDLKGIDINELFRILSLKMGMTIVPSKNVAGRVNIFLNNLTFEDALDVILISQDLASDRKGKIINIMTSADYERLYGKKYNEKKIIKTIKLRYAKPSTVSSALGQIKSDIGKVIVDESSGTVLLIDVPEKIKLMSETIKSLDQSPQTEIFDLKYAKSADIKTQLSAAITSGTGELYVDERSSKVIVSDLPNKMKKIRQMVKALDEPSRQVFIEAEIIQIELTKEYQRSINWERIFQGAAAHGLNFIGTFPVSPSFTPSPSLDTDNLQISIGTLDSDNYSATMKLLETFGQAKVLSRPRIAVLNNQEAKVLVGTREAYITSTQSQAETTTITSESVEFIDVGVKLNLTPTINKDGFVTLKIKPEVSSVADTITTQAGSRIPIVKTSEAETVVKVKDGTMVMIAGLMEDTKRDDTTGIPFFAKIPIIGGLFGAKANQNKRAELVVFITPHIFAGDERITEKNFQKLVPADMVWDEAEDAIMDHRLDETGSGKKFSTPDENLTEKTGVSFSSSEGAGNDAAIQEKIKGFKKY
jgi:type II secretory pathway component GspD/PulD (secretin)